METSQEEESFLAYVNLISSYPLSNVYGIFNSTNGNSLYYWGGHLWDTSDQQIKRRY